MECDLYRGRQRKRKPKSISIHTHCIETLVLQLKKNPVHNSARLLTEHGVLGLHGPHVVQIVYNLDEETVIIQNHPMEDVIVLEMICFAEIVLEACVNVSLILHEIFSSLK